MKLQTQILEAVSSTISCKVRVLVMHRYLRRLSVLLIGTSLVTLTGCSFGPSAIQVPQIKPGELTETIFAKYDQNSDSKLSSGELESCPGMLRDMGRVDTDGDKHMSKGELSARFEMWVNGGIGASRLNCRVTKGGRPLANAHVKLVPEDFFEGLVQPAEGTTDSSGIAQMGIASENLPSDMANYRVVQQGYYKVEITHPSITIPAEYNTNTKLGVRASFESGGNIVNFKL